MSPLCRVGRRKVTGWESYFRRRAAALGLVIESIHYDPAYGWTVLLEDGREFEAPSTGAVTLGLERAARESSV